VAAARVVAQTLALLKQPISVAGFE